MTCVPKNASHLWTSNIDFADRDGGKCQNSFDLIYGNPQEVHRQVSLRDFLIRKIVPKSSGRARIEEEGACEHRFSKDWSSREGKGHFDRRLR